jgi:hypothetical protein
VRAHLAPVSEADADAADSVDADDVSISID